MKPTGIPTHTSSIGIEHSLLPWLSIQSTYEYYGNYAISLDNTVNGGSYQLLTLSASAELFGREDFVLDLALMNALNESYEFKFGTMDRATHATPGAPRQLRATLNMHF